MLTQWITTQVPHLDKLAGLRFERVEHERFFSEIDWVVRREDYYGDNCFEVRFDDVGRRLVAAYESPEFSVALGLYALTFPSEPDEYYIETNESFDDAFDDVLELITPLISHRPNRGTYDGPFDDITYNYVYWRYPDAFMTLVQHFEGDGHVGHLATLDIRVVPNQGAEDLEFPLKTNNLL